MLIHQFQYLHFSIGCFLPYLLPIHLSLFFSTSSSFWFRSDSASKISSHSFSYFKVSWCSAFFSSTFVSNFLFRSAISRFAASFCFFTDSIMWLFLLLFLSEPSLSLEKKQSSRSLLSHELFSWYLQWDSYWLYKDS